MDSLLLDGHPASNTSPGPGRRFDAGRIMLVIGAVAVGIVFAWAGLAKIAHPDEFLQNVRAYRLFPSAANGTIAIVLPWLELTAGIACFLPSWRRAGAVLASIFLASFVILIPLVMMQGPAPACGCFGRLSHQLTNGTLIADFVLLLIASAVAWRDPFQPDR